MNALQSHPQMTSGAKAADYPCLGSTLPSRTRHFHRLREEPDTSTGSGKGWVGLHTAEAWLLGWRGGTQASRLQSCGGAAGGRWGVGLGCSSRCRGGGRGASPQASLGVGDGWRPGMNMPSSSPKTRSSWWRDDDHSMATQVSVYCHCCVGH